MRPCSRLDVVAETPGPWSLCILVNSAVGQTIVFGRLSMLVASAKVTDHEKRWSVLPCLRRPQPQPRPLRQNQLAFFHLHAREGVVGDEHADSAGAAGA